MPTITILSAGITKKSSVEVNKNTQAPTQAVNANDPQKQLAMIMEQVSALTPWAEGKIPAERMVMVGIMLKNGWGIDKSYEKAKVFFALAAQQGDAEALFHLGLMQEQGLGTPVNYDGALEMYENSCDKGFLSAHINTMNLYGRISC